MEVTLPELIDKWSILKLKIENTQNFEQLRNLKKELVIIEKATNEFRKKGLNIKKEWLDKLYDFNKEGWVLYDKMAQEEKKENPDFKEMGRIYISMQITNKKRVAVKNQITEETGEGFKDVKVN